MLSTLTLAFTATTSTSGGDAPTAAILLAIAVILAAAKIGGDLATRAGQPAVLGELAAGVFLGNLGLVGISWAEPFKSNATLDTLAQLGVIILLFEVGLESTVREMLKVGLTSLLVAVLGVVTPFALGWGVGALLLPDRSAYVHAFLGATLTATSVGITARVLRDLGKGKSPEARVILGAAVIDDVLGLVILAVVAGVIQAANTGAARSYGDAGIIVGKAALFLLGALGLGLVVSPRLFGLASRLKGRGVLLATALVFCFGLSYLASAIGLAAIVGAYAAGLILEDVHYRDFTERGEHGLEELLQPIGVFLVPVFFVLMGMRVDLAAFGRADVLGFAALLTLAAVVGKQACALGAWGRHLDRLSIGLGMIPRGEVGLIFANIGLGLVVRGEPIVDKAIYSAVVIMVIVTTMATPPALRWSLVRGDRRLLRRAG
ncbi:MAG TPA: cation:proton antiporter [Gemmatimonadales bacterium]|nr:cation:proton antiporter [Gemmatimonadales bacterium]